jgi:hypothetical protein
LTSLPAEIYALSRWTEGSATSKRLAWKSMTSGPTPVSSACLKSIEKHRLYVFPVFAIKNSDLTILRKDFGLNLSGKMLRFLPRGSRAEGEMMAS